jgi:hypothetical protein
MDIGLLRPAFCWDIRLLGKDGTLGSALDNLPFRWFMCADGRGVLSAGVEIVLAPDTAQMVIPDKAVPVTRVSEPRIVPEVAAMKESSNPLQAEKKYTASHISQNARNQTSEIAVR